MTATYVYVGSETSTPQGHLREGNFVFRMDASGSLEQLQAVESGENPSFLALHPGGRFLYAINEKREGGAAAFGIDAASGRLTRLNSLPVKGLGPCYISLHPSGNWALVANYGGGSISVLSVRDDGSLGEVTCTVQHARSQPASETGDDPQRQEGPHAHSILPSPDARFVLAADLGTNRVYVYRLNEATGQLEANADFPAYAALPGAGPRHMAFHPNHQFLYIANELNNTVTACRWDAEHGRIEALSALPTLPERFTDYNLVADIHFSVDGSTLYVSNRGHDSLAVYAVDGATGALTLRGHVSTEGHWPRNFCLSADGRFLLLANQESSNLILYTLDAQSGMPHFSGQVTTVHKPFFVTIVTA